LNSKKDEELVQESERTDMEIDLTKVNNAQTPLRPVKETLADEEDENDSSTNKNKLAVVAASR
jgi:hypothetical protein